MSAVSTLVTSLVYFQLYHYRTVFLNIQFLRKGKDSEAHRRNPAKLMLFDHCSDLVNQFTRYGISTTLHTSGRVNATVSTQATSLTPRPLFAHQAYHGNIDQRLSL